MSAAVLKLRVTEGEWLNLENHWNTVHDQNGKKWYFKSSRRVRGSLMELTYA